MIWSRWGARIECHPADWSRYGGSAGCWCHAQMIAAGAAVCLA